MILQVNKRVLIQENTNILEEVNEKTFIKRKLKENRNINARKIKHGKTVAKIDSKRKELSSKNTFGKQVLNDTISAGKKAFAKSRKENPGNLKDALINSVKTGAKQAYNTGVKNRELTGIKADFNNQKLNKLNELAPKMIKRSEQRIQPNQKTEVKAFGNNKKVVKKVANWKKNADHRKAIKQDQEDQELAKQNVINEKNKPVLNEVAQKPKTTGKNEPVVFEYADGSKTSTPK
jgi:hypothetical protein